jgi:N-acetylmuramoyl-L-alanine amidase
VSWSVGVRLLLTLALALLTAVPSGFGAAVGASVTGGPAVGSEGPAADRVSVKDLKPRVVWKRIPYGDKRRRQMAAYSRRHYGTWSWHLDDPRVVVQHYTDGASFSSAWNTFAANSRHLGELPGTCAHFIIATKGTIYQLVPLAIRCRHAVGMNWTSVGIEHVGTSDRQVLHNRRQMRSSLRLTVWLMARFGINVGNVIGHAETLESRYHRELYPSWRCLVHADFPHRAMRKYRSRLRDLAEAKGVRPGPGPAWVKSGC